MTTNPECSNAPVAQTTEDIRRRAMEIGMELRAKTMTAPVARAELQSLKVMLNSLRYEMQAANMGATFVAVRLWEADRPMPEAKSN